MEKWTKEQAEKKGKEFIDSCFKYCNEVVDYSNKELASEVLMNNVVEKLHSLSATQGKTKEELDIQKHNLSLIIDYAEAVSKIIDVLRIYMDAERIFRSNNIAMIRVANMTITAETKIELEAEYNNLLDAIPKEAKGKINKNLLKHKDIEKDKAELPSIDFICGIFESTFIDFFELPTFKFAELEICIFICETIFAKYGITKKLKWTHPYEADEYKDVLEAYSEVVNFSKRYKDFEKTKPYLCIKKYGELNKMFNKVEYKADLSEYAKIVKKMLQEKKEAREIVDEGIQRLYSSKQRWWYCE